MKEYYIFSNEDKKLGYGDGRRIELGVTHKVDCEPILCKQGLHASAKPLDALQYAKSSIIWKVTLGRTVIHGNDKSVATERTYIKGGIDISDTLRKFARLCASDVVHLWDAPQVVIDYLKTGDEKLRVEAYSVSDSARYSASDSARYSARASAFASASASAFASAFASASDSARAKASARYSAKASARYSVKASAWASARYSVKASAWASTLAKQNRRLAQMISNALSEAEGKEV